MTAQTTSCAASVTTRLPVIYRIYRVDVGVLIAPAWNDDRIDEGLAGLFRVFSPALREYASL